MSEFVPGGSNAKMTKSQVKKYIKDMKKAQELAKQKLEDAKNSGIFEKEAKEVADLEKLLDSL